MKVISKTSILTEELLAQDFSNRVIVMMSSGNFGGIDWEELKQRIN
jgi:hypothetical protein